MAVIKPSTWLCSDVCGGEGCGRGVKTLKLSVTQKQGDVEKRVVLWFFEKVDPLKMALSEERLSPGPVTNSRSNQCRCSDGGRGRGRCCG